MVWATRLVVLGVLLRLARLRVAAGAFGLFVGHAWYRQIQHSSHWRLIQRFTSCAEPLFVVAEVAGAFDKLGVRYLVGGSLASSVYGIPRATQNVDLVADLPSTLVDEFCSLLQDAFYIDGDMIREAIQRKASFNIVHLGTMFKADVFIMKGDSWSREEMSRVARRRDREPR